MIYSGSVLPNSGDNYKGVGLELVGQSGSLRFRTNPSLFDVRADSFFVGRTNSQFISGSEDKIEISSSNFHLSSSGDVVMAGTLQAGSFISGSIKSSIGLGILLKEGIGDTIRVSLSDDPVKEVAIGNEILKSLNLRNRGVKIISCPSCARQGFQVIDTVRVLEEKLSHIKTPITLSIIGCVVNGPGEAAMTDVGITGGQKGSNMLYLSGVQSEKVMTDEMITRVIHEVEKKASELENNSK